MAGQPEVAGHIARWPGRGVRLLGRRAYALTCILSPDKLCRRCACDGAKVTVCFAYRGVRGFLDRHVYLVRTGRG